MVEDNVDMMALLSELAPLQRTLASKDTDVALDIVSQILPGSEIQGYKTGSKVWSWEIPKRWELESARLTAGDEVLIDSSWHPLHIVNYSQPFKGRVSHEELIGHIHTNPSRPNAIPFHFSFYEQHWGFSIPQEWLGRLNKDNYDVEINCRFEDGDLNVLSYFLPGRYKETFIICADICHPTQVNDSLTGLAAAVDIMGRLNEKKDRKYSYLLLVVPETIGSIAYLANNPDVVKNSVGAVFSEMLGTQGPLVGQRSRRGNTYWDRLLEQALNNSGCEYKIVDFMKSACNDEKIFDSPGVDIPAISLTRYPYPEYHTSDDNIDLIDVKRLREARDVLQSIIDISEGDYVPVLKHPGPVFLSGHELYPDWRSDPELLPIWESYIDVMYSLDNASSIVNLSLEHEISYEHYKYWCDAFASKGLVEKEDYIFHR
ncbi:DUF4910 domain-containing protein [Pseudomonadota bacterium]